MTLDQLRMKLRERMLEHYLVDEVETRGGTAEKFTSPGSRFVPDRIVTWPNGIIHFAELKTIGGKLSPGQERDHERRRKLGCLVWVFWTRDQIDEYIRERISP
jgi:hypothetical protein